MSLEEGVIVERLRDTGNRLLKLPSGRDDLLKLLEDLEGILSKVEQGTSLTVQAALLPSLKALISDHILQNSDSDIKITVAVCFNEIMRITAPDSPYEDDRMKEIFELIVASFDKLSLLSGISYSKAVSIIKNVASVRSCVMMLDIGCDKLIIEMFKQFKRNLRSDHPSSVFSAMEDIMSLIVDESEDISLELLKALLDFVYKAERSNQNTSPVSWRLGVKVMARSSKKIRPYFKAAIQSGDIKKDDYVPLIYSILEVDFDMEQNNVANSTKKTVPIESVDKTPSPVIPTVMEEEDTTAVQKPLKSLGNEKQVSASDNSEMKSSETQKDTAAVQKPLKSLGNEKQVIASDNSDMKKSDTQKDTTAVQKPLKLLGNEKQVSASDNSVMKKSDTQKDTTAVQKPLKSLGNEKPVSASDNSDMKKSDTQKDTTALQKPLKSLGNEKQVNVSDNSDMKKSETQKDNEKYLPIEGREASFKKSPNPLGSSKKRSAVKTEKTSKDVLPKKENEIRTNSGEKSYQGVSVKPNQNGKNLLRTKKGGNGGSGNKGLLPSNMGRSPSENEGNGLDGTAKKVLRRKRDQMEDEVFETPFGIKKYKEDIVGCKLKVWWPKDKAYYEGRITSYSSSTRKHRVDYDDGDVEYLHLVNERFEFLGDEIAVINRQNDVKPNVSPTELEVKQDNSATKTEPPETAPMDTDAE